MHYLLYNKSINKRDALLELVKRKAKKATGRH